MATDVIDPLTWPRHRLGEALEAMAAYLGGGTGTPVDAAPPAEAAATGGRFGRWLDIVGAELGLEVEPVEVPAEGLESWVSSSGPAILRLTDDRFLVALGRRRGRQRVLDPGHRVRTLPRRQVVEALFEPLAARHRGFIATMIAEAGIAPSRRDAARGAVLRYLLASHPILGGWLLRLPPSGPFGRQLRRARQLRWLLALVGAHGLRHLLWIVSWWMIGRAALGGRFDRGWLVAWALVLLTLIPLRLLANAAQGFLSLGTGALVKKRLLLGTLRLDPDDLRLEGAGRTVGRVVESDAIETLALSTGFRTVVAVIEIAFGTWVLALGASPVWHLVLVAAIVVAVGFLAWHSYRLRRSWTTARLDMTHDLVERLVGHRTRLAQEPRERWHRAEDTALGRYLERSRDMDAAASWIAVLPRIWMVLGFLGFFPAVLGVAATPASLAVSLGGILLLQRALDSFSQGLSQLAGAAISWQQVAPVFRAASVERNDHPDPAAWAGVVEKCLRRRAEGKENEAAGAGPRTGSEEGPDGSAIVVEGRDVTFTYASRARNVAGGAGERPVLRGFDLRIHDGDRILLEGPSGGGKSSLASLLIGLRQPTSGLLLLRGLDRSVLGSEGWRRLVVSAPQFHENHVFTETFAFNLLMGRGWPPARGDLEEAESLCRELGLGDLLERMPAGLLQMVGESGWQLSHGERSRLFLARALLQGGDLLVFDESFAALDPENLDRALRCVLDRASTLLVIAHP